jgi:hypothetical protein
MDLQSLFAALVPLGFIIYWLVSLLKNLTNKNWSGATTQLIAFGAAVVAVVLYAHSSIDIGGTRSTFDVLGWTDQVLLALAVAATGGVTSDTLRTFNRNDDNVQPTLIPPLDIHKPTT